MWPYVLTFVAGALIPLALAAIGGHLATLALAENSKARRWALVIVWGLAITGVVSSGASVTLSYRSDNLREGNDDGFRKDVLKKLQAVIDEPNDVKRKEEANLLKSSLASVRNAMDVSQTGAGANHLSDLRRRTNDAAQQIIDFVYAREGPINSWKQQAMADAFINGTSNEAEQFRARLQAWTNETQSLFLAQYWAPQILPLLKDLQDSGVDTFPVTSAFATGGPRRVGLMLSVVAERIGKKSPFPRVLTPLEAATIIRGTGGLSMKIYADLTDPNSLAIAETLRRAFAKSWSVDGAVLPLQKSGLSHGIHILFPSADWTVNFEGMILAFETCDLDPTVEVRPMKQPPTILKIEVWPGKADRPDFPIDQLMPPSMPR